MLNPIGRQTLHGYNPNEARDWHGRWTTGGGASGGPYRSTTPIPFGPVGRRRGLLDPETFWPQAGGLLHGGRLIRVQNGSGRGIGDNQPPEAEEIPAAEPFPSAPRVPQGWDTPGHIVGGLEHPPTRHPVQANGTPWLIVGHDEVKTILALQHRVVPSMVIFVPVDGLGPLLLGSTNTADFEMPPGYEAVTLKGTPQVTHVNGQETGHAADSIDEALRLAATNRFSTIYFNRSFSTITDGTVRSPIRSDVVAVARPPFSVPFRYHPYESFSEGQSQEKRQMQMPPDPSIAKVYGRHYYK